MLCRELLYGVRTVFATHHETRPTPTSRVTEHRRFPSLGVEIDTFIATDDVLERNTDGAA